MSHATLLTADDVAALLQVPTTWVYRQAREGALPSVQCGRYVRFLRADIDDWISQQRAATLPPQRKAAPASAPTLNRGLPTEVSAP